MIFVQFILAAALALLSAAAPAVTSLGAMDSEYAHQLNDILARNPTTTHLNKRQSYQWVCNDASLTFASIRVCQNYLEFTIRDETCTVDKNSPGRLCENGPTKVTGTSWLGKKETVECVKAGDAVEFLFNNCGEKGGSAVANGNGNFIVHVNDKWAA